MLLDFYRKVRPSGPGASNSISRPFMRRGAEQCASVTCPWCGKCELQTKDGRPVIAHNNWSGYLEGSRWNVIFDIRPARSGA